MVRKSIRISSQSVSSELTMLPSIESVKQQRLKISMTQKELANLVGVSTSMINQIESGRSAPSYNTAKRIFEVKRLVLHQN